MISTTLFALALQTLTCDCPSPDTTLVIGHRGSGSSSAQNPFAENTLPSIANAYDEGADLVEIDVHLSRDGEIVLLHDFTLDKTTDLEGCVADYDYATLATADATVGSGAKEKVGIPRLGEVLELVKERDARLNIELKVQESPGKCPATDIDALAAAVVDAVEEAGLEEKIVFSSFSFDILQASKDLNAGIAVALLSAEGGSVLQAQADDAKAAGFEGINPLYVAVSNDAEGLQALQDKALLVSPWTVNDQSAMRTLIEARVHALITDDVPAAVAARDDAVANCTCPGPNASSSADDSAGGCRVSQNPSPANWQWALFALAPLALRRLAKQRG